MSPTTLAIPQVDEEVIADALKELLGGDEFVTVLQQAWDARQVVVPFVTPEQVFVDEVLNPDRYPACEIVLLNSRVRAINAGQRRVVEFSVQWSIAGSDEEIMSRQLRRYMTATIAFLDCRSLMPNAPTMPVVVGDVDYGALAGLRNPTTNNKFLKSAGLSISVETFA